MKSVRYLQTLGSFRNYYRSMNEIFANTFGKLHMLHYPFYMKENESLEERQNNLIRHCLSYVGELKGKELLEVGCGNGLNCHFIESNVETGNIVGIDLNQDNLDLAREHNKDSKITFVYDNAQELNTVEDASVDVLICIESAFHYPDKNAFFKQMKRVLKPDGVFLIVDILRAEGDSGKSLWFWKKHKMLYHANEAEYNQYSDGNNLSYNKVENITKYIIQGYEGHLSWINKDGMSAFNYRLLKVFSDLQVKLNVRELKSHKQYILFYGGHKAA